MRRKQRSPLVKLMETGNDQLYETTYEDCYLWFKILNREIFDNKLPPLTEFKIGRRRGTHAYYERIIDDSDPDFLETRIHMNKKYKSKKFMISVLVHEMIHHYQIIHGLPFGHGPSFYEWSDKLAKKGLLLARSY